MSELNGQFKNKRILIVGGGSGIGFATAKAFVNSGAAVVVASRSKEKIEHAVNEIGNGVSGCLINISDSEDVESTLSKLGEFHHIVISAAPSSLPLGRTDSISLDDAYSAMDTKFWGAYRIARLAQIIPGGSLTILSGILSKRPTKSSAILSAINAALDGLVRGLALERAPIRVNSVSPGSLGNSPLFANMTEPQVLEAGLKLPVGKIGTPESIADAILFLAGNTYVTGSTLIIDGGRSIA